MRALLRLLTCAASPSHPNSPTAATAPAPAHRQQWGGGAHRLLEQVQPFPVHLQVRHALSQNRAFTGQAGSACFCRALWCVCAQYTEHRSIGEQGGSGGGLGSNVEVKDWESQARDITGAHCAAMQQPLHTQEQQQEMAMLAHASSDGWGRQH